MQSFSGNTWALICAHNESDQIGRLVQRVVKNLPTLTIDDGSDDNTALEALTSGALVLIIPHSLGKGNALAQGLRVLRMFQADYVICLDGDGQHDPQYIPKLAKTAQSGLDIVLGNRLHDKHDMPFPRIISNTLTSLVISLFTRILVRDSQCGYRILSHRALQLDPQQKGFMYESEQLFLAARFGLRISHIDISTIYHPGAVMRFHIIKEILSFFSVLIAEIRARFN